MIQWKDRKEPVSDATIAAVEVLLGVRFPEDLRTCLRDHHGGTPADHAFLVPSPDFHYESGASLLLSLDPRDSDSLFVTIGLLTSAGFPANLIPLFDDGGGDLVCFDTAPEATSAIVYWERGTNTVVPLAASFTEFLAQLRPLAPVDLSDSAPASS